MEVGKRNGKGGDKERMKRPFGVCTPGGYTKVHMIEGRLEVKKKDE